MKKILLTILGLLVIGGTIYYFTRDKTPSTPTDQPSTELNKDTEKETSTTNTDPYEMIGTSVEGRAIQAYRFGTGERTLIFVGAMHGGYEWNSALFSYELIDYLTANPASIPNDLRVMVIPVANPDGLASVVGTSERFDASDAPQFNYADEVKITDPVVAGRFNANAVDLNRNFDCKWQSKAVWRDHSIKAGTAPFSEPEAMAIRDFLLQENPDAVVFYHSASNGVYTSFCDGDPLPSTIELLTTYSKASGYKQYDDYPYYEVTGDAADWLSTQGIAAITVEMATHTVTEWDKNLAGIEAIFNLYSSSN